MAYPGGKAGPGTFQRIINHMPPHRVYVEPFLGGGAVLRAKRPAAESVGIDLDPGVIAAWAPHPGSTVAHGDAIDYLRSRPWTGAGDEMVYADPPYMMDSRTGGRLYRYELTDAQHAVLLDVLCDLAARGVRVMVSGYYSKRYAAALRGWTLITFGSMTRRGMALEHLWMSFPDPVELHDYRYLGEDFRERERIKRKIARWRERLSAMPRLERQAMLAALAGGTASPGLTGTAS